MMSLNHGGPHFQGMHWEIHPIRAPCTSISRYAPANEMQPPPDHSPSRIPLIIQSVSPSSDDTRPKQSPKRPVFVDLISPSTSPQPPDNRLKLAVTHKTVHLAPFEQAPPEFSILLRLYDRCAPKRLILTVKYRHLGTFEQKLEAMTKRTMFVMMGTRSSLFRGQENHAEQRYVQESPIPRLSRAVPVDSDDEDVGDIPYVASDIQLANAEGMAANQVGISRTGKARAEDWADSSDEAQGGTNARSTTSLLYQTHQGGRINLTHRPIRGQGQKFTSDIQRNKRRMQPANATERSRSRSTLSTGVLTNGGMGETNGYYGIGEVNPPHENQGQMPAFARGKRVVAKDGYSMTPNAIDYRKRKAKEADLSGQFRNLLDQDIVDEVESEGWITPNGRLLKSGCRMMERVKQERREHRDDGRLSKRAKLSYGDMENEIGSLKAENDRLKGVVAQMREVLSGLP